MSEGMFPSRSRRAPRWIRVVSTILLPVYALTFDPVIAWGATDLAVEPVAVSSTPVAGPEPGYQTLVEADAQFQQLQQSAPVTAPEPARAIEAKKPFKLEPLPESPSDQQLRACGLVRVELVPFGKTSPEENAALARVLEVNHAARPQGDAKALVRFLMEWPGSAWRASVLANLAEVYTAEGHEEKAQAVWKKAWGAVRAARTFQERNLASAIVAGLTRSLVATRSVGEFNLLLDDVQSLKLTGTAAETLRRAKSDLFVREQTPVDASECGATAVRMVFEKLNPGKSFPKMLTDRAERQRIGAFPATAAGINLSQLKTLAESIGLPARLGQGSNFRGIPVPAIVHWKRGHYGAIVDRKGDRFELVDPATRGIRYLSSEALAAESSGHVLFVGNQLPAGWTELTGALAAGVYGGTGSTPPPANPPDKTICDPTTGDGGCSKKMPTASIALAQASLTVVDTPVWANPAVGDSLNFTLRYDQRILETVVPASHVGTHWTTNFTSYAEDHSDVTTVNTGGSNYESSASGYVKFFLPGGGVAVSKVQGPTATGTNETLQCPGNLLIMEKLFMTSEKVSAGGSVFQKVTPEEHGVPDVDCVKNVSSSFPRVFSHTALDGTSYLYHEANWCNNRYYLSQIFDPQGNLTTLNYEAGGNGIRLASVTTTGGVGLTFEYTDSRNDSWVTKVNATGGRSAILAYDDEGRLTSITDAGGLMSSFVYRAPYDHFIAEMHTPYGESYFSEGSDTATHMSWVETVTPAGGKERVELWRDAGPNGVPDAAPANEVPDSGKMAVRNEALNSRVTFHWDTRAMDAMTDTQGVVTLDYAKASQYHWLLRESNSEILPIYSSVKHPLENRIWYLYEGSPLQDRVGTSAAPIAVGRVVEDGSTQATLFGYNADGRLTSITDPVGRKTEYVYTDEDLSEVRQITTAPSFVTLAKFEDYVLRRPQIVRDAANQEVIYQYNLLGQTTSVSRLRNSVVETFTYEYYATGGVNEHRLWKILGPAGQVLETYTYDAAGRMLSSTDVDNYTVYQYYDHLDRPQRTVYPDGTYEQAIYQKLDAEWQRDTQGRWTRFEYNNLRQLTAVTDPQNRTTRYEHCPCGALETIIDPAGNQTHFEYDLQGRLTRKADHADKATTYGYAPSSGRLIWKQDARNQRANYQYFTDGNLQLISYSDGPNTPITSTPWVSWTYDLMFDRVKTMIVHDGTSPEPTTTYNYKEFVVDSVYGDGQLESVDGPFANDTITFSYDQYGRVKRREINGVANFVENEFDALGRVTWQKNLLTPTGSQFTYTYDPASLHSSRVTEVNNGLGFKTTYEYYANVAAAGTGNGDRRLSAIKNYTNTSAQISQSDYQYSPAGNITQWKQTWGPALAAGHDYVFGYDAADQLIGVEDRVPGQPTVVQNRFGYTYDKASNRTREQIGVPGTGAVTVRGATYDSRNRITSRTGGTGAMTVQGTTNEPANVTVAVETSGVVGAATPVSSFAKKSSNQYEFEGTANVAPASTKIVVQATDGNNNSTTVQKTISVGGTGYTGITYDDAGNMLNDGVNAYTWDAESRLVTITRAGNNVTEFTYDGYSRRVRTVEKTNGVVTSNRTYVWDGLTIAQERDATGATVNWFGQGEQRASGEFAGYSGSGGIPAANGRYFNTRDHLGSIREVVDEFGAVRARYDYDPYGRPTVTGPLVHESTNQAGLHQHFFNDATQTLTVGTGDKMVVYVYLDPASPPTEIMLQWNVGGSWEQRAYWGANNIGWGADGTNGRRYMGPLPPVGKWVRLEVPAGSVGLEGQTIKGMAFTLWDGKAKWDHAGKVTTAGVESVWSEDAIPAGAWMDGSWTWTKTGLESEFGYTGHPLHVRSGLHLAPYRAYSAELGRWINRDPIEEDGGVNLYGYVLNDPVNRFDLLGLTDSISGGAATNPGATGHLAREVLRGAADDVARHAARKARTEIAQKAFGNGLEGAKKACQETLKKLGKEGLEELREVAKTGMRKAAEQVKNADNARSFNAGVKAFETQMHRCNAIEKALKALQ